MINHLRHLGKLISMGNRDTRVYNYAHHMMYEIWENNGYMNIYVCKKTGGVLDSTKVPALLAEYEKLSATSCDSGECRISPLK